MTGNASEPIFKDEQLLAYLDGEAGPEVAAQIEASAAGKRRAGELAGLQSRLISRLYRATCPDSEILGEYHLGLLPDQQAREIEAHLRDCSPCVHELVQLRDFLDESGPGIFN